HVTSGEREDEGTEKGRTFRPCRRREVRSRSVGTKGEAMNQFAEMDDSAEFEAEPARLTDRALTLLMCAGLAAVVVGAGFVHPGIPLLAMAAGLVVMVALAVVAAMRVVQGRRLAATLARGGAADHPVFHRRRAARRHVSAA